MNYKEKYNNALIWVESIYPTLSSEQQMEAEGIFPEIAESEDERIRRALIEWVKRIKRYKEQGICSPEIFNGISSDNILAWLEKQGEQKPIDKVETKFKVGDWIFSPAWGTARIIGIGANDSEFLLEYTDGTQENTPIEYVNSAFDKWTIQKAWDGDVLACGDKVSDCPFIFHNLTEELDPRSYCGVNTTHQFQVNDENGRSWCCLDGVRPATKEQQDYLFKKMKEAGYEWEGHTKMLI